MDTLARLGFLNYARVGRLYIVGDTIFVFPTRRLALPAQEIGSFTHHVKSFANQAAQIPSLGCESKILASAGELASRLSEMRFCLTDLIDSLKGWRSPTAEAISGRPQVDQLLANLTRNGARFQRCAASAAVASSIASELSRQIRPPCGIFSGTVVPIKEVPFSKSSRDRLCIADKYYVLNLAHAKSLESVGQAIRQRVVTDQTLKDAKRDTVTALAESVVGDAMKLFELFPSTACGSYRLIFKDACQQLQHNGRGDFVLVRGPLQHSLAEGSLFVGLPIRGNSRRQWMSVSPTVASEQSDFWTAQGQPAEQPMCMGSMHQYAHLLSPQFTSAEAVIQWLDAGVIVATARPEYHATWRSDSCELLALRRVVPVRGGRRNG